MAVFKVDPEGLLQLRFAVPKRCWLSQDLRGAKSGFGVLWL